MNTSASNYLQNLLLVAALLLGFSASILAQGTVKGKITDEQNNAIAYANVLIVGTTMGAAADSKGNYIIEDVPAGSYDLKASSVGYKSVTVAVTITDGGKITQDFTLSSDILNLQSVVITGTAGGSGIQKKEASFSITTITPRQLEQLAPPSTAAALDLVPGVWSESSGGVAGANIFVRGLPSSGDAPFVTMAINGAPIYGTQTLSFFEQSSIFRIDETVANTEAVRGGPSSVFSNGESGLTTNQIRHHRAQTIRKGVRLKNRRPKTRSQSNVWRNGVVRKRVVTNWRRE